MVFELSPLMTKVLPALFLLTILAILLYPSASLRAKNRGRRAHNARKSTAGGFPNQRKAPHYGQAQRSRQGSSAKAYKATGGRGQNWGQPPGKHQAMW